jgi:hypothetical protein
MAKVIKNDPCPQCIEFLTLVKGQPLTRIACANCRQAKQDLLDKARSSHRFRLRAALGRFSRRESVLICWARSQQCVRGPRAQNAGRLAPATKLSARTV